MSDDLEVSHSERLLFWETVMVLASLSAIGSAAIIILSIILKHSRNYNTRLICYLSFADFMISVICLGLCGYNLRNGHIGVASSASCYMQPIITWYFIFASIVWIGVIAYSNYHIICLRNPITLWQEILANVLAWGLPMIAAFIPIAPSTRFYGQRSGLWCSYDAESKVPQIVILSCFVVPVLFVVIFSYVKVYMKIRKMGLTDSTGTIHHTEIAAVKKMWMYTGAYLLVWFPMFVAYIAEAILGYTIPFWAEYLTLELVHMQGIFNFILYGLNTDMRHAIVEKFDLGHMLKMKTKVSQEFAARKGSDVV